MQHAARSLQARLVSLLDDAQERNDPAKVAYFTERISFATALALTADPDDSLQHDTYRRLFTAELAYLAALPNDR